MVIVALEFVTMNGVIVNIYQIINEGSIFLRPLHEEFISLFHFVPLPTGNVSLLVVTCL